MTSLAQQKHCLDLTMCWVKPFLNKENLKVQHEQRSHHQGPFLSLFFSSSFVFGTDNQTQSLPHTWCPLGKCSLLCYAPSPSRCLCERKLSLHQLCTPSDPTDDALPCGPPGFSKTHPFACAIVSTTEALSIQNSKSPISGHLFDSAKSQISFTQPKLRSSSHG